MKLFQKFKERKAKEIQERKSRLEQSEKLAEWDLNLVTTRMLSSPCAVNGMNLCDYECVHYKKGYVAYFPPFMRNKGFYYAVRPTCRLWGGK